MENKKCFEIEIEESITGKQRPRMNTRTGKTYTPTKSKNYEYLVRYIFVNKYPNVEPIKGKVKMTIIAYYELPKKRSKLQEAEMLAGIIQPTKKPDWDNIGKIVSDALNKFAFLDDNQITEALVIKRYARVPKTYVKIEEY